MRIQLITGPDQKPLTIDAVPGITAEELAKRVADRLAFPVVAARRNQVVERLTEKILEPCTLELLDTRNRTAELIVQNSLTLLYLKAAEDVLGKTEIRVEHTLNKGLFTEIRGGVQVTAELVVGIRNRMKELVSLDLPILRNIVSRGEAMKMLQESGMQEKIRILEGSPNLEQVKFYSLDGFRDFFYGTMVPSTGYLPVFELRKYKNGILLRFPMATNPNKMPKYQDEKKVYQAFDEASHWQELLGISYAFDLNDKIRDGKAKEVIQLSEALHEMRIVEIAKEIAKKGRRIILIAGPSSSGKTTFARRLCIQLQVLGLRPLYLGTDDYFVERDKTPLDEKGEPNFEDLEALDIELFNHDMNALLSGREADLPTFDFVQGRKIFGQRKTRLATGHPIVIEGIHGLNPKLTPDISAQEKFRIYISPLTQLNIDNHNRIPTTDSRMLRRMVRDSQYRGKTAQGTIREWPKVREGEDKNIFPYNSEAHVFFNSVHIYELAVLKKYAEPLLQAIGPEEPEYSDAARLLRYLRFFRVLEEDGVISNSSILREFIGGSIFVDG